MKKIKNPLHKRLPRELKGEFSKYLVIFLFMTVTIGFVSGFLVAGGSMIAAYRESFEKYNIEDGHFVLAEALTEEAVSMLEQEDSEQPEQQATSLYPDFYLEEDTDVDLDGITDSRLRIYVNREEVNLACMMEGAFPENAQEIAIDRMYAENNHITVGDTILVGERKVTVSGLVALSDYSALFSDNGDIMFDAVKFGVGVMTGEGFAAYPEASLHYNYSWKYQEAPEDEIEEKKWADEFMRFVYQCVLSEQNTMLSFVPRYANQAIQFTGDDFGGDRTMIIVLLYVLIVIMAFVFSITIGHTIRQEAGVIGTLRASGYTKGDMLRHYLTIPMLVTLFAALFGNILGYTVFKNMVADMYYGSYSLPTYVTRWNAEAFVLTTIVPMILMFVTNVILLARKLHLSPLQFLRHDLSGKKHKRAVKLPKIGFFHRFRIRILLQNAGNFIMLFIGIVFSVILLLFGMMMNPLLHHYQDEVIENMRADYQYIIKMPVEVTTECAEKYSVTSLYYLQDEEDDTESVSVYGIMEDSRYVTETLPEEGVCISDSFAEKYRLHVGDTLLLREEYGKEEYEFEIRGIISYPMGLAVFMKNQEFCKAFGLEDGYYNGYFSDEELTELSDASVISCITQEDLTKLTRQMDVSMGSIFQLINVFAVVLAVLLIYLLTKLILERNASSISMVKILGYENGEIARLYLAATTIAVTISVLLGLWIATVVMERLFRVFVMDFSGWLSFYVKPITYVQMFFMCMGGYAAVALLQFRKIRRIPMDQALKNVE